MKFLADINLPQSIITALSKDGHDVLDIKKQNLSLSDIQIIQIAKQEKRIIVTRDKDFIALSQFPKYQVPTIVIRLTIQTPQHIADRLFELLENQSEKILTSSLSLIKEHSAESHPY
jgi:predicted nuclease of predicted toxin-antitoxin system